MEDRRLKLYKVIVLAEAAWLILFGFVIFAYVRSNQLKLLLAPGWAWIEIAGGVLAVLTSTAILLIGKRQEEMYVRDCCEVRARMDPLYRAVGLLLLVGILVIGLAIPGRTLTADLQGTVDLGSNPFVRGTEKEFEMARRKKPEDRDNKDWLVIFSQDPDPTRYEGEKARLTGRVWRETELAERDFYIVRYLMTHCIACVQPMLLLCRLPAGEIVPETEQWVTIEGEIATGEFDGEAEPFIKVDRYNIISTPEDPYIYP